MEKRHTKPCGTPTKSLRIDKSMVKTNSPQNESGIVGNIMGHRPGAKVCFMPIVSNKRSGKSPF